MELKKLIAVVITIVLAVSSIHVTPINVYATESDITLEESTNKADYEVDNNNVTATECEEDVFDDIVNGNKVNVIEAETVSTENEEDSAESNQSVVDETQDSLGSEIKEEKDETKKETDEEIVLENPEETESEALTAVFDEESNLNVLEDSTVIDTVKDINNDLNNLLYNYFDWLAHGTAGLSEDKLLESVSEEVFQDMVRRYEGLGQQNKTIGEVTYEIVEYDSQSGNLQINVNEIINDQAIGILHAITVSKNNGTKWYIESDTYDDTEISGISSSNLEISYYSFSTGHPNTWKNTGDQAMDIANIALTQVGYHATNNHTKYNNWYYGYDNPAAWCAIFISWCADQAGVPRSAVRKNARASGYNTSNMSSNPYGAPAHSFSSTAAKVGDIAFIDNTGNGTSNHVGLVYAVDSTYIYTVEGNYSEQVYKCKYLRSTGYQRYTNSTAAKVHIVFYARPNYAVGTQGEGNVSASLHAWISDTIMGEAADVFITGKTYYFCYELLDVNTGKKLDQEHGGLSYTVTEKLKLPNGVIVDGVTYDNDNNYCGWTLNAAGSYAGIFTVSGDINLKVEVSCTVQNQIELQMHRWISDAKMGDSVSEFKQGEFYYDCYELIDKDSGARINNLVEHNYTLLHEIYNPDGTLYNSYTHVNKDNEWIGFQARYSGTYTIRYTLKGTVGGNQYDYSFDKKINVMENPITITASKSNVSLVLNQKESETIDVAYDGYYNGNISFHWERSNSNVDCTWGDSSGKTCPLTITAKVIGNTLVTVSMIDSNTKEKLASTSISVSVEEKSYTISYNANGGTAAPTSQIKAHDSELILSSIIPKRFGYNFLGWNTSSGASYAQYKPKDSFTKNENTVLYAVWKSAPAVTLVSESFLQSIGNVNIEIAGTTEYICITPQYSATYFLYSEGDYDTVGYLYDLDGNQLESNDDGGDGQNFKMEYPLEKNTNYYLGVRLYNGSLTMENIRIMAERKHYTVTFDSRGGTDIPEQIVQNNGKVAEPDTPLREGYIFGGWYTDTDCILLYDFDAIVTRDLTLYAKWEKTTVESIKLDKNMLILSVGETALLKAEITPNGAMSSIVTWMSSDTSIAKVEDGLVTAVSDGVCTITASSENKSAVCSVRVTRNPSTDDIASGSYENVRWRIDNNGKLIVEGTGDFADSKYAYSADRVPWSAYKTFIKSAEINLKDVVNTSFMFYGCENLVNVDMRQLDTSNVTNMSWMFHGCSSLTNVDVSGFDTGKVEYMTVMFHGCSGLTSLDVSGFDTRNVLDMEGMFGSCSSLASVDVSGFDTGNATDMRFMFDGCSSLTNVDVSGFDTGKVMDMGWMFDGCRNLVSLDLSSFDMGNVTEADFFLSGCDRLSSIYAPRNCHIDGLKLPTSQGAWHDLNGNEYSNLPTNREEAILLVNKDYTGQPVEKITARKTQTIYHCGDTINTDDIIVMYYAKDGTVKKVSNYMTNVSDIDMTTLGKKTLIITYIPENGNKTAAVLTASVTITVTYPGVKISGIEIKDSVYNKTPAFYTGTAKITSETDNTDLTNSVKLAYTYSGLQADGSAYAATQTAPVNAGNYKLTVTVTWEDQIYVGSAEYPFKIAKAPLTVTARDIGLKIGAELPKAEDYKYDIMGLLEGDKLTKEPEFACGIASTAEAGTYEITVSGADAGMNYEITYKNGTLTVSENGETAKYYTVTFNLSGKGNDIINTGAKEGSLLEKPQDPQAEGYTFTGWYKNQSCTVLWDFATDTVTSDITLYAGWKENNNDPDISDNPSVGDVLPEDIPTDGKIPDGLWIAGIKTYTYTGQAIKPEVRVYDSDKLLKLGQDYTISYKNNTKANDASKESTAPAVVVKGKGNYTGTEKQTFEILPLDLNDTSISVEDMTVAYNKKVQKKVPVVTYNGKKLANNKDFTVSYPDKGTDAYKALGIYNILLTAKQGGNFAGTRTVKLAITNNTLISGATVKKILNQTYTGKAIEPELEVAMKKVPLVRDTDYTVAYVNNTEAGTATVILTGIGEYAGTKKVTFKINGTSLKGAVVSGITDKVYNGTAQEQKITVTLNNKPLTEKNDYEVIYSQNTKAGKATVTIKGIKAYSGTVKKTFKITAYDMKENAGSQMGGLGKEITAKYVKGGSKPKLELTFAGKKLIEGTDYKVSYQNNKTVTMADTKNKPTITIKGKGNFKGSLTKTFTIIGKALNDTESPVTLTVADKGFVDKAGKYISVPILTDADGKKLVAGKDYERAVVYTLEDGTELTKKSKVNAGTKVKVRVTGKGAYTRELEGVYQITKNDFNKAKIIISPQTYTGKAVTLDKDSVTVKIGKETLAFGTDYEIVENSYANNVQKGTASVTIVGKGNYGGTKTVKFRITARKFSWFWRLFG